VTPRLLAASMRLWRGRLRDADVDTNLIVAEREQVKEVWQAAAAEATALDAKYPASAPGYFLDRYGFARLRSGSEITRTEAPRYTRHDFDERERRLDRFMVPAAAIGGWVPVAAEESGVGPFYEDLRKRWAVYASGIGLPRSLGEIANAAELTWREIFDDSVFYPAGPAIPGATFMDTIDDANRRQVLRTWGPKGPVDFFCLMHQVHENLHKFQTGEPLLNEVVQAAVWVGFLDANPDLWAFQIASDGGASAVRELRLVRRLDSLVEAAVRAGLDTARMVEAWWAPGTYFLTCLLANRFDGRQVRYNTYLNMLGLVLTGQWDTRTTIVAIRELLAIGSSRRLQEREIQRILGSARL
jgi:hypothetical protein